MSFSSHFIQNTFVLNSYHPIVRVFYLCGVLLKVIPNSVILQDFFSFFIDRKMKTNTVAKRSDPVERLVFPSERKINKMCSSRHYPKPPCTSEKKFTCHAKNGSWYLQSCAVDKSRPSTSCYCTVQISGKLDSTMQDVGLFWLQYVVCSLQYVVCSPVTVFIRNPPPLLLI